MDNLQFLYLPNSSPKEVQIALRDNSTGKILGHVYAIAEDVGKEGGKSYSGGKIPGGYINYETSGEYVKRAKPHMYVDDLFVTKEARHKGLGSKLLGKIVQESENRGFKGRIILFAGNTRDVSPLPFYYKLGFRSGDKYINHQIEKALAAPKPMNNLVQSFMALSKNGIKELLKSVR